MVRSVGMIHVGESFFSPITVAIGVFVSVTLLVGLCAKHAKKYTSKARDHPNAAKMPLPSPKQLMTTISHKAKKSPSSSGPQVNNDDEGSGVWQKAILMGEKCQPPEFSGVIYYDYSGNRISEMPKSPRATSMSPLRNFTFPTQKNNDNSVY